MLQYVGEGLAFFRLNNFEFMPTNALMQRFFNVAGIRFQDLEFSAISSDGFR